MLLFPATFVLWLHQIALGGLFAMAATPFHELTRGFYKSTAAVLLGIGLLGLLGKADLYRQYLLTAPNLAGVIELLFHILFIVSFSLYLYSLWRERVVFRARVFSASLISGLAALAMSSRSFSQAPLWSPESLLYPLSFLLSALLLGGVTVGMLIGHWYLIDTGQSIEPFIRIFRFFFFTLLLQTFFFLLLPPLLYFLGSADTVLNLKRLWENHYLLLVSRLLTTQVGSLILCAMIWRTLKIPHTMAATGLFYIALLGVFVGEILGRQILALTSLPF